jgi:hypothetical protein
MMSPVARPDPRPGSAQREGTRRLRLLAVVVAVLAVTAAGAWLGGFRMNLTTRHVSPPTAAASPEQVVTTYVEAYDHRDFATLRRIYPSQLLDRHRALGTMNHLVIVDSRALDGPENGNPARPGRAYHRVRVTVDLEGLQGSDLAYRPGPNGWAYLLERDSPASPWTIADHGNP